MSPRMSMSMTVDQVRSRTKTVTRRHVDTWKDLKSGDRLTLIEKGMGLPKGSKQTVITDVEVTDVRVELLYDITDEECAAEGFPHMTAGEFAAFWMDGHGYNPRTQTEAMAVRCRRIAFRYLDEPPVPECIHQVRGDKRDEVCPIHGPWICPEGPAS